MSITHLGGKNVLAQAGSPSQGTAGSDGSEGPDGSAAATAVVAALARLTPIGLDELVERAALQARYDRKYVLPLAQVGPLLSRLDAGARVLEIDERRSFRYQSVYFDTADLTSFRLAALRRRRRFKIRTRSYLDTAGCWLEVKTEGARGGTVKNRVAYHVDDERRLDPGRAFVDEMLDAIPLPDCRSLTFAPTVVTRYRRSTLYLPATGGRATIDVDLGWTDDDGRGLSLPGVAIVETKTGSRASEVDRLLWAHQYRPVRISKYATGLAALRPELPAVPWRRTLRRYFTDPLWSIME